MSTHGRRRTPVTPHPAFTPLAERAASDANAVLAKLRHELRTPINAIIGYGEMILDEADDHSHPDLFPDLEGVIAQGRTLLALLNRALYSSDRSGVVGLQAHSIFIGPLRDEFDTATLAILDTCEWLQRAAAKAGNESLDADLRKIAMAAARVRAIVADVARPPTPPDGLTTIDDVPFASAIPARPRSPTEPGRVLVVDDQSINRELLTRRLEQDGYVVVSAGTGRAALERLRGEAFDVILLDVMMPGATGFEVLSRLKTDPRTRHIPVLMISALDEMQSVVRGIEMGADDYLTTPIDPILLRARISSSLERKRTRDDELAFLDAIRRETESAHDLSEGVLPRDLPRVRGLEMASLLLPAQSMAGDFHEVVRLDGDRVGVVLADVHSSSTDTRLFIALTRSVLRTFAERLGTGARIDPLDVVLRINSYVRSEIASTTASLIFAVIDPRSGMVQYVNAGHSPPVILGPAGIRTVLIPTGPTIGAAGDAAFARETTDLAPGDCLLIYSDGVTEAQNENGAVFSEQRLHDLLSDGTHLASALVARVEDGVREFMGNVANGDDITVLAIRRERRD